MTNLEINLAKNVIENMSAETKVCFMDVMDNEQRRSFALQSAKEVINKRIEMSIELITDPAKMQSFASLVNGHIHADK